jgi:serine/threonine-protein kinase
MGVVYAARHELLGQRVALKLIRPEYAARAESVARFLNEARAAASIDNEHVARVLDVGMLESGLPYMVLEYLDGTDLANALHTRGPLPVADVADYLLQSIEAVAHAHAAGIVHRDLKPSNIFLARRPDGTSRVKVLDFGISKITGADGPTANITRTHAMLGSPAYMSPEQLRDAKSVDQRSDIWALGVVAYELLTGRLPFDANNSVALFAAIQESEPVSVRTWRKDVGYELDAIVAKCLRRLPEERFVSVTELAFALAPFGTGVAATACASSNRILPRAAPSSSASSSVNAVSASQALAKQPAPLASTVEAPPAEKLDPPISRTLPGLPPWPSAARSGPLSPSATSPAKPRARLASVLAVGLVAALGTIGWLTIPRLRPAPRPANLEASPSSVVAASTPPTSSTSPSASAPTPAPGRETSADTRSGARPAVSPLPARAAPPASAPRTTPSAPHPSCNPPYEFDKDEKKIWKRECL